MATSERELVVLESFRAPRATTNPYISQLATALDETPGLAVRSFDWRTALVGRYDVVHLHWPEILVARRSWLRNLVSLVRTSAWVLRLWVRRTPLVRTMHNRTAHEQVPWWGRPLLRALDRLTVARIELNPVAVGEEGDAGATTAIPHGHYRDWYSRRTRAEAQPGRVAAVGLLRAYKATDALIAAVRGSDDPSITLRVAGAAPDAAWAARLATAAGDDPRVEVTTDHLDDGQFVYAVTAATLIALPYTTWHNSGAALAALSLGRPVLVPDMPATRALAAEVGHEWVCTFEAPLTADVLARQLASGVPAGRPNLAAREWSDVGERHLAVFRTALAARRFHSGRGGRTPGAWRRRRGHPA